MLVLARDPQPKDPKKAFTLWWVDSSKPGIKINPLHKIGWHMLSTCEVYLDNVEVEESDMVGEEGMGFLNVMYNFEMERLINAARSTGFAECAFEDAARYANQRIAFGKPIGHNQMIQEKLALMAIKIDNMRNMVLKVAWQADQHQSLRTSAALAKLYCARTAMEVIDDAIQIMGGLGYTDEARVSRFWRDVRCETYRRRYRRNYDLRSRSADPERLSEQIICRRRSFLTNCAARFIQQDLPVEEIQIGFLVPQNSF